MTPPQSSIPRRSSGLANAHDTAQPPSNPNPSNSASDVIDTAVLRKNQKNTDLIAIFSRPCAVGQRPSAQGVGLYTHILGSNGTPEFLPVGGPDRMRSDTSIDSEPSEEIKALWMDMQQILHEEDREARRENYITFEELKQRYVPLSNDALPRRCSFSAHEAQQQPLQDHALIDDNTAQGANAKRKMPLENYMARRRSVTHVTTTVDRCGDEAAKRSERAPVLTAAQKRNEYEPGRDPRR